MICVYKSCNSCCVVEVAILSRVNSIRCFHSVSFVYLSCNIIKEIVNLLTKYLNENPITCYIYVKNTFAYCTTACGQLSIRIVVTSSVF